MPPRKHAYMVLATTLLVFLGGLFLTLNMDLDQGTTALLPDTDPVVADVTYFMDHLPAMELIYLQLKIPDPLPTHTDLLSKAGDALYAGIQNNPWFKDIFYQFTQKQLMALMALAQSKKYRILTPEDWEEIQKELVPEALDHRLDLLKKQVLAPSGLFTAKALVSDPLGLAPRIMEKMATFNTHSAQMDLKGSRIISTDGRRLLIMAAPNFPAADTARNKKMMDFLKGEKKRLEARFKGQIHLGISGAHVATLDNATTIQADVERALIILSLGILILGLIFFGHFSHVLLVFVPTLVSLTTATALLSLFQGRLSAIALGCGAILVGITVDFGIHLLFGVDQEGRDQTETLIRRLRSPIATGAATTMAAFGCLIFSSLPGQRQMGWLAILGIFSASTFTLFILKYFIALLPRRAPKPAPVPLVKLCHWFMGGWGSHPICVGLLLVLVVGISATGLSQFQFQGDMAALNHLTPETRADQEDFMATWAGTTPTMLLVKGKDTALAQAENDALFTTLLALEKEGKLNHIGSLSAIFPGPGAQKARYEHFCQFFTPDKIAALKADWARACQKKGFAPEAFDPFFQGLKTRPAPLVPSDFTPTVAAPLIRARMVKKKHTGSTHILTTMKIPDPADTEALIHRIKKAHPGTKFINYPFFVSHIAGWLGQEFKRIFCLAALAMVGVLFIAQKRIKTVGITILPVVCAAFTTAGFLGLTQIPVNLISIIFITFVFGVGVDFSIFLVHQETQRAQGESPTTAGAVIICALTTMGAFACLIFARHHALFSIGVAGLTGMVTSLISALILVPFLVKKLNLKGKA